MRKIICEGCNIKTLPTPPEDAALGLIPRRTHGKLISSAMCDYCDHELRPSDSVVALSIPADMGDWEKEYLTK